MKQYKTVNNLVGWLTFIIAATVYCMTIEPTASFWDCPEFITTGYKLEVGHPPGAPFFMLTANLFSQFASDATTVAKMVNYMSALMSGACILFLFWSITHLVRKLIIKDENNITTGQLITIMGSGLVGALVYTFSDTFWFSAVEGEVYAYSSLFTAVVFWLILKWEDVADQPHSDRWIILIAYLTGLSIGVHLLNLLCLPAIVLVYYYKKVPNANAKGSLLALFGSMVLVGIVLYGIVPGVVKVGGWFELLFVNSMGLPFNTGVIVYIIILAASIIWGVYESYTETSRPRMNISFMLTIALLGIPFYGHGASSVIIGIIVLAALGLYLFAKKLDQKYQISARTMNTALLCTMMIMVGYSSYALIVIRSTANTPMDQNSPEDIFTLGEYLMTEDGRTVFDETAQAFAHLHEMEAQIEKLNKELETRTDYESDSYMALIEEVSSLSEKYYSIDATNYEEDVEKALLGLGFRREDFGRQTSDFSGGWRMRIELAKLLLQKPDVLLLDEPTNHLDIESIQWLEDFLINNGKAVIVISHDRKFVDNITTRTIEVTMGRIYDYKVNYSQYLQLRKERREQQQKAYDEQQKFIAETKEFIERFKGTYSKTLQVQSRVKMLEKLELLEVDEEDTSALRLKFPPSPRSGSYPVIMENVGKTYGEKVVFKGANLTIERGDKVAFVGKNGEGKSTLVKCIMREIEHDGTLTLGHNVQIGYFAQNQASLMDENLTVFQTIDDVAKGEIRNKIRDLLGAFMFGGPEESMKKVKVLSGGERTRLAMIKLLLEPVNLLILDEPTNHLDMKTKDILKQALLDFDGTLIVVSHDRDFLDGLVSKVYEFGNQKVTEHLCGIYEFLEKKKMDSLQELEKK